MKRNKEGRLEFSSPSEQKEYESRRAAFLCNQDNNSLDYLRERYGYHLQMVEGYKEKIVEQIKTESPQQAQDVELIRKTILQQQQQIEKLAAAFTKLRVGK